MILHLILLSFFQIFTRSESVSSPGLPQMANFMLLYPTGSTLAHSPVANYAQLSRVPTFAANQFSGTTNIEQFRPPSPLANEIDSQTNQFGPVMVFFVKLMSDHDKNQTQFICKHTNPPIVLFLSNHNETWF